MLNALVAQPTVTDKALNGNFLPLIFVDT